MCRAARSLPKMSSSEPLNECNFSSTNVVVTNQHSSRSCVCVRVFTLFLISALLIDLELALSLATAAGEKIAGFFHDRNKSLSTKSASIDVVTETDKACEALIIGGIRERYPTHHFIAEESHAGDYDWTDEPTWIIDPIDGTTNFVHAFPFTCVSIALAIKKEVVVAVVHNPIMHETFHAVRGSGAFLNGEQRLAVRPAEDLSQSVVITEFGYDRTPEGVEMMVNTLRNLLLQGNVRALRSLGTCALNMCSVAMGRANLYYEGRDTSFGPKPWDSAAGSLIVTEAGGFVFDTSGGEFDMFSGRVVAACSEEFAKVTLSHVQDKPSL